MNKLTPQQLVLLNRKLIGESDKIDKEKLLKIDFGEFEEMADIPYQKEQTPLYTYKDTVEKAAVLGHLIAKREPFVRSNKETAALALLTLLDINCHKMIENYGKDIVSLLSSFDKSETDLTRKWIEDHLDNDESYKIYLK